MPIVALLLAAATPVETVAALYAPYARAEMKGDAGDGHWSAETGALVKRWKQVTPADEVDDLGDFDWLCHCQDWDHKAFRARVQGQRMIGPNLVELRVRVTLAHRNEVGERLLLKREAKDWRVDDVFATDLPRGLKDGLRRTIAADLRRKRR
ncbi:MAG: DUF3828 domain-containing protein [Sphingomonadales bacterium]|nr:DUF3828 domain-containing protein [Sphingomonadales bacterium]